jgi:hypothetical protein
MKVTILKYSGIVKKVIFCADLMYVYCIRFREKELSTGKFNVFYVYFIFEHKRDYLLTYIKL